MLFTTISGGSRSGKSISMATPEDPNAGLTKALTSDSAASLGYLCDLIQELKQLADRSGQRTLSAILAAALTEARLQKEQYRHRPSA